MAMFRHSVEGRQDTLCLAFCGVPLTKVIAANRALAFAPVLGGLFTNAQPHIIFLTPRSHQCYCLFHN